MAGQTSNNRIPALPCPVHCPPPLRSSSCYPIPQIRMAYRPRLTFPSLNLSCIWCSCTCEIKFDSLPLICLISVEFLANRGEPLRAEEHFHSQLAHGTNSVLVSIWTQGAWRFLNSHLLQIKVFIAEGERGLPP